MLAHYPRHKHLFRSLIISNKRVAVSVSVGVLQLWLLAVISCDLVKSPRLLIRQFHTKEHSLEVRQVGEYVCSRYVVRQTKLRDCVTLLTGNTLFDKKEVDHDVVGGE